MIFLSSPVCVEFKISLSNFLKLICTNFENVLRYVIPGASGRNLFNPPENCIDHTKMTNNYLFIR